MDGAEGSRASSRFAGAPARVAVLGAGAWGTALAAILAQREPVTLVCHSPETAARIRDTRRNEARLPGIDLPDGIRATDEPAALAEATDLVVVAVPSTHVRQTLGRAAAHIPAVADVLSVVKGIEPKTHLRMTQVIAEAASIDPRRVAALSGPNLALEIARRLPASAVVAAEDVALGSSDPGAARPPSVPALRQPRRARRRAVRRPQEHRRDRRWRRGGARLRRQRQGGADDPRPGRDDPSRDRSRREPADVRGPGRHRRRHRHLRLVPVAQPSPGRRARTGPDMGRHRGHACRASPRARTRWTPRSRWPTRLGVEMPIAREVHRALFEGKSVKRCLIDLLARESKDELADYDRWAARLSQSGRHRSTEVDSSASGRGAAW